MRISVWIALTGLLVSTAGTADTVAAARWIDQEFKPSTLTRDQQQHELQWFIQAAERLKRQGIQSIRVVSEKIDTHDYESRTLSQAFTDHG